MAENKVFGRDELLGMDKSKVERRYIESLGADVYFRELSALDQDKYEWSLIKEEKQADGKKKRHVDMVSSRLKYLVFTLCDKDGKRLFGEDEWELLGATKEKAAIRELHQASLEVNGMDEVSLKGVEGSLGEQEQGDSTLE